MRKPRLSGVCVAVFAAYSGAALPADTSGMPHLLNLAQSLGSVVAQAGAAPRKRTDDGTATRVRANRLEGVNDMQLTADGKVSLKRGELMFTSDKLKLDQVLNEVTAEGNVEMRRDRDLVTGPRARLNLDTWTGEFEKPSYRFQRDTSVPYDESTRARLPVIGSGKADTLLVEGQNQFRFRNASYTTCLADDPDWYLKVRELELDYDKDRGEAHGATINFKDVPIAYLPWMDFPLTGKRQSGFLAPTLGSTTSTGLDFTVPYYLNLAPNYDATIAPRYMKRRGTQLGTEFRYLVPGGNGVLRTEWLPRDQITERERGLFSTTDNQDFGGGLTARADYTQVSDKTYFADMSSKITSTSQATLNQQLTVNYAGIGWLPLGLNVQRSQTIVGVAPYDRLPQFTANLNLPDAAGVSMKMPFEYTHFHHPSNDEGTRTTMYPQLGLPIESDSGFFRPKIGVHLSSYDLSRKTTTGPSSVNKSIPTASLDTGLIFERETTVGKGDYTQTLEPRIYYVRTAYRDQSDVPVFDTAKADFNFAQLFSDNLYSGNDRIANSNQLTTAVTSRFIERESGGEALRVALGQRFYFSDQKVTLPGETAREGRVADWLGLISGRVARDWWVDQAYQYNPRQHRSERGALSLRYQPMSSKVASLNYHYERGLLRDIDVSSQWPIAGGWYAVGRYNYNLHDHRLTEAIAGFEYKAGCWVVRTVWQTLLNTSQVRNNAIFLQLELNGLTSVGSSPVQLLKRSVGGYSKINGGGNANSVSDPVFGADSEAEQ